MSSHLILVHIDMANQFKKALIKHSCSFNRFMESELDLNDIIQEMHVIATIPDLYHLLVELHAVQSLLGLLSHENTDILSFKALLLWDIKAKLYSCHWKQVLCTLLMVPFGTWQY